MNDQEPLTYESRETRRNGVRVIPPSPWRWMPRHTFWLVAVLLILAVIVYFLVQIAGASFPAPDSPYDPPGAL